MKILTTINKVFAILLIAILVDTFLAYRALRNFLTVQYSLNQTHDRILAVKIVMESLLNTETGQRGYIITSLPEFLEPYQIGKLQVNDALQQLKTLLSDESDATNICYQLNELVEKKMAQMQATVALAQAGKTSEAVQNVKDGTGTLLMDQIRGLLNQLEIKENTRRNEKLREREALVSFSILGIIFGLVITSTALYLGYYISKGEVALIENNKEMLKAANEELELRVSERTEKLNSLNQELERSNRELQDFAFVASHDLQEPLRKIQAFGDLLKQDYGKQLGVEGTDFIERMQNASRRMERLIKDLLAFSRVTTKAQPFTQTDLNWVAKQVLIDLETRIKQTGGQVLVDTLPVIEGDAMQIRQLLQNLIGNALKFHRPGVAPIISVTGECHGAEPTAPSLLSAPQMCQISVADNGIGFDEKYLDRIFTPFQRLHGKNEFEGTGMGLAICRKVVERHGGTITAKSQPGVGTTFLISLPLKQPRLEATA